MFRQLVNLFANSRKQSGGSSRRHRRSLRTTLTVEHLEGRWAPATLYWYGNAGDNWSDNTKWRDINGNQPAAMPGAADSVVFRQDVANVSKNTNCTIDAANIAGNATVTNFTIQSGYTQTITIGLDIASAGGVVNVNRTLTFTGGAGATIKGATNGNMRGAINVNGLDWQSGKFETLDVTLNANKTGTISGTGAKEIKGTTFTNAGTLTWTAGDIATTNVAGL